MDSIITLGKGNLRHANGPWQSCLRDHQKDNKALMLFEGLGRACIGLRIHELCRLLREGYRCGNGAECLCLAYAYRWHCHGYHRYKRLGAARIHSSAGSSRVTESATAFLDLRPQVVSIVRWFMRERWTLALGRTSHMMGLGCKALSKEASCSKIICPVPLVSTSQTGWKLPSSTDCEDVSRTIYQKCIEIVKTMFWQEPMDSANCVVIQLLRRPEMEDPIWRFTT